MITFKELRYKYSGAPWLSESNLKPFQFPAGEAHLKDSEIPPYRHLIPIIQPSKGELHDDLFTLAMATEQLSKYSQVILPYFPGARADRGTPLGVKVYADFLASVLMEGSIVHSFDVHSNTAMKAIYYALKDKGIEFRPYKVPTFLAPKIEGQYDGIIAPDSGALTRASHTAIKLGIPVFPATKTRDFDTGKLTGYSFEHTTKEVDPSKRYLVVDDICDGGGTFTLLAHNAGIPRENLDLYVSHGVFSGKALEILPQYYNKVITTDSYDPEGWLPEGFERLSVVEYIENIITEKKN